MVAELPAMRAEHPQLLFVGIDRGRAVLPVLRELGGNESLVRDVLLEEWRTFDEELPADVKGNGKDVLRTAKGDLPELAAGSLDAAVFADGYSRLWDPAPLLKRLEGALRPTGYVAILDRAGPDGESRPIAGHHRRISPGRVKSDMEEAGFKFVRALKAPAEDRFFLLFQPR